MIDTLFSLAEAHLFMQLVELQDEQPDSLPAGKTRPDLYRCASCSSVSCGILPSVFPMLRFLPCGTLPSILPMLLFLLMLFCLLSFPCCLLCLVTLCPLAVLALCGHKSCKLRCLTCISWQDMYISIPADGYRWRPIAFCLSPSFLLTHAVPVLPAFAFVLSLLLSCSWQTDAQQVAHLAAGQQQVIDYWGQYTNVSHLFPIACITILPADS